MFQEENSSTNIYDDPDSLLEGSIVYEGNDSNFSIETKKVNSLQEQASNISIFHKLTKKMKELYFKLNISQKILMISGFGLFWTEIVKLCSKEYSVLFFLAIGIPVIIFALFAFIYKKEIPSDTTTTY